MRDFVKTTSVDILDDSSPLLDRAETNPFGGIDESETVLEPSVGVFSDMEEDENIFDDDDDDIFNDFDEGEPAPAVAESTKEPLIKIARLPSKLETQGSSTATTQPKKDTKEILPEADFEFDWD